MPLANLPFLFSFIVNSYTRLVYVLTLILLLFTGSDYSYANNKYGGFYNYPVHPNNSAFATLKGGDDSYTIAEQNTLSFGTQTIAHQFYALNVAIPSSEPFYFGFPKAMGGNGGRSYTIAPLPIGLTFNGNILTGTPTVSGNTTHIYQVTDVDGNTAELSFQITVRELTTLSFGTQTIPDKVIITGEPFDFLLPEAEGGHGNLVLS